MKKAHKIFAVIYLLIALVVLVWGTILFFSLREDLQTIVIASYGILALFGIALFGFLHWSIPEVSVKSLGSKCFFGSSFINILLIGSIVYISLICRGGEGCLAVFLPIAVLIPVSIITLMFGLLLGEVSKKAKILIVALLIGAPLLLYLLNGISWSLR